MEEIRFTRLTEVNDDTLAKCINSVNKLTSLRRQRRMRGLALIINNETEYQSIGYYRLMKLFVYNSCLDSVKLHCTLAVKTYLWQVAIFFEKKEFEIRRAHHLL